VGVPEARQILVACGASSALLLAVRFAAAPWAGQAPVLLFVIVPVGIIFTDYAAVVLGIIGVRVLRRMLAEREGAQASVHAKVTSVPTMLIGAGQGGVAVAKEIRTRPSLGINPVGFLDDDPEKVGTVVHGIPVVGTTARLGEMCARYEAEQVLVTIARVSGSAVRRIVEQCEAAGLPVKIIPALYDIVAGKLDVARIRNVAIEDLLGRDTVQLDMHKIAAFIQGKTVLVTGAGGSIGSELCRQVARFSPSRLLLVERFETALFDIDRYLRRERQDVEIVPYVADITDHTRMQRIFQRGGVDVVFHAAAHKHVPMMEDNPGEAIKNNVLGTKGLADMSAAHGVGHFVMISTDKAVNPTSVMGASKRVAELYVQGMDQQSNTTFVSVRFGNVLGSNGSVIPVFKQQIADGGPVTVTHPEMTRYFMTIPEATQLVLQAASLGKGGEVFILDMGEPVRIVDLAHDLIRLSGLEPNVDIPIEFSGIRPGEKLFEELATDEERAEKTRHEKIFIGRVQAAAWDGLCTGIERLARCSDSVDHAEVYEALRALIPEFSGGAPTEDAAKIIPMPSGR
jgi:FlaA1/EpsC-like NDP-sugar epimerase